MKRALIMAVFFVGLTGCLVDSAMADWAAIAYCRNTGASGWAYGKIYKSLAVDDALYNCRAAGGEHCVIEMSFENQCGSLARSSRQYVVAGWSDNSKREAGNNALASCGSGCELVATVCSNE